MSDDSVSVRFRDDTALSRGLRRLLEELQHRLRLEHPLALYLAGGMAVHLYTGMRVTTDVDAEFGARVAVPNDLLVEVTLEDGSNQVLYFDTNYNPMFALMHEDYRVDAIELDLGIPNITLLVLSPLELAVSKLARFADNDREDIATLIGMGLVSPDDLERRATEALSGFVGGQSMVRLNIDDALRQARQSDRGSA